VFMLIPVIILILISFLTEQSRKFLNIGQ
jgi:hypothetical protein